MCMYVCVCVCMCVCVCVCACVCVCVYSARQTQIHRQTYIHTDRGLAFTSHNDQVRTRLTRVFYRPSVAGLPGARPFVIRLPLPCHKD